jgi:hypothetical protein
MQQLHLCRKPSAYVADQQMQVQAYSLDARELAIESLRDEAMHFMAGGLKLQLDVHLTMTQTVVRRQGDCRTNANRDIRASAIALDTE